MWMQWHLAFSLQPPRALISIMNILCQNVLMTTNPVNRIWRKHYLSLPLYGLNRKPNIKFSPFSTNSISLTGFIVCLGSISQTCDFHLDDEANYWCRHIITLPTICTKILLIFSTILLPLNLLYIVFFKKSTKYSYGDIKYIVSSNVTK